VTLSVNGALAGKPEPTTGTPATAVFDDLAGDAIRSDGNGSYDATIEDDIITIATGKKRNLSFDFSTCLFGDCTGPFVSSTNATLTVRLLADTAFIEYTGGGGEHALLAAVEISAFDDDDDGTTDRYVIETSGESRHSLFRRTKAGGRGVEPGHERMLWIADFSVPWGVEVTVD